MIKALIRNDGDAAIVVTTDAGKTEVEPQGFIHVETEVLAIGEQPNPDGAQAALFTTNS